MPQKTTRKQTGIRLDTDLAPELKIRALRKNISYEDLVNSILWNYVEKNVLKPVKKKKIKIR
jgi:predicted HicB family RNase H-like nuclease